MKFSGFIQLSVAGQVLSAGWAAMTATRQEIQMHLSTPARWTSICSGSLSFVQRKSDCAAEHELI